jgi:hypothetical protein
MSGAEKKQQRRIAPSPERLATSQPVRGTPGFNKKEMPSGMMQDAAAAH